MAIFPEFLDTNNKLLNLNQLDNFDSLWQLDTDWFEEPNYRRNGWSGVCRLELNDENGHKKAIFIKRQENHNHRSLLHPIIGIPTFRREFINFKNLAKADVPSLEPIYYGEHKSDDGFQAILVTKALENYISAEEYFSTEHPIQEVHRVLEKMAYTARLLHNSSYRHGSLYPKHFFIKISPAEPVAVKIIDLEKLKWLPIKSAVMFNDIDRLIRRKGNMNKDHMLYFLEHYLKGPGKKLSNSELAKKLYASAAKLVK